MCEQKMPGEADSSTEEPAGENHTGGESVTVLVIDDNMSAAAACRMILTSAGYHVLLAQDGGEGLEILRSNPEGIDLVVLDWILPGMAGDEWLELMVEIVPDLKVIFCSGYFITGAIHEQLASKVRAFLKKPFDASELLSVVERALRGEDSQSDKG